VPAEMTEEELDIFRSTPMFVDALAPA
jgi:hypothetical protein